MLCHVASLTVGHQNPVKELYAHSLYVTFSYVNGNLQNAFVDGPPIVLHTTKVRACKVQSYSKYCFQYFSVLLFLGKKVHFHELRRNTTCTVCPACYFNTNIRLFLTQFLKQLLGLGSGQLFTISKPF